MKKRASAKIAQDEAAREATKDLEFKYFSIEEMQSFANLDVIETIVYDATVKDVIRTVQDPHWWEKKVGKSNTSITDVQKVSRTEKRYVRDVRVRMGPFKFVTVYNVSQIISEDRVEMHAFDRAGDHLVSQFTCVQDGPNVQVSYAEVMKAGMLVIKLGAKPIRAARIEHLERLQDRVRMRLERKAKKTAVAAEANASSIV